ncbi:MAG TPA: MerR family transcriptional regulator [Cellulomonas sp.]
MSTAVVGRTYAIEEVGRLTGLTPHTLRYYERIGLLETVPRAASGHRRYTEADLGWVRFVVMLRQTGMSIADSLQFMELTRAGDHTVPERVRVLREHRDELVAQLAVLQRHLGAINRKIDVYEGLLHERS